MSDEDKPKPPTAPDASGKPTGEPKPRAPKPVTMLSGTGGYTPPRPKRTQVPPGYPAYYPNDLKVETDAIVSSAVVKFTEQTQASQLCKYVITEMTKHFVGAVATQKIKAHEVKGHVERLIHWLLVYNCDYSREGYTLENEIRNSAEWSTLVAEVNRIASVKNAVPSNSGKTGQRKSYRAEVRAWMEKVGLPTVGGAAQRLGVSETTLKSIMSDKGEKRYSDERLREVLKKIGHNS